MKINNWNNLTQQQCIVREICEELATEIKAEKILGVVDYDCLTFHLTMHCILCTIVSGELKLLEHEDSKWLNKENLRSVEWFPADYLFINYRVMDSNALAGINASKNFHFNKSTFIKLVSAKI